MSLLRRPGGVLAVGIAVLSGMFSLIDGSAVASDAVGSVSNPPVLVPRALHERIAGGATVVSVYASAGRRLVKGDVRLASRATVHAHRVALKVPKSLPPGTWFIVVCPAGSHPRCAASHRPMLKAPAKPTAGVPAHPVAEPVHAASATIGTAGATLTAIAANGTRFRLDIPANSVPDGTKITMTPLSALSGPAWAGKLVGGVQLAPEGLVLMRGAMLTITPKTKVPIGNEIGVGYARSGSDLHEVPLAPTRAAIEIPLAHFSGAGLGDVPGGAGTPPGTGSTTDAYNSQLAGILNQWRDGSLSDSDMAQAAGMVLDAEYKAIMSAEVPPGLSDDAAAQTAISDLLQWARAEELLSINPDALGKIAPTLQRLLEGMYTRAQQKCAGQHDLTQLARIIGFDRSEQLIGLNLHTVIDDVKCARFRVDFDSTVTITPGGGYAGSYTLEYVAHPTVTFLGVQQGGGPVFTGTTTGSYAKAQGTITDADAGWIEATSGTGATFAVDNFCIPAANSGCAQPSLLFDLGMPTETYLSNTGDQFTVPYWAHGWQIVHADLMQTAISRTTFALPLNGGSGALIASTTLSSSGPWGGTGQVGDSTTIDVYHTPPGT